MGNDIVVVCSLYTLAYTLGLSELGWYRSREREPIWGKCRCQCSMPVSMWNISWKETPTTNLLLPVMVPLTKEENYIYDPEIRKRETRTRFCVRVGFLESIAWEEQMQKGITVTALFTVLINKKRPTLSENLSAIKTHRANIKGTKKLRHLPCSCCQAQRGWVTAEG